LAFCDYNRGHFNRSEDEMPCESFGGFGMSKSVFLFNALAFVVVWVILLSPGWAESARHPSVEASLPTLKPVVMYAVQHDTSPALRDLASLSLQAGEAPREIPLRSLPKSRPGPNVPTGTSKGDPVVQSRLGALNMPLPIQNFEGIGNRNGVLPPDTEGDIGYDPATGKKYYVQWVNLSYAIWDVTITPTLVLGPVNGNTLWSGFGGPCQTTNNGDPITLYDPLAHRWFMSQFAIPNDYGPVYYQCVAVSQTADPLGQWYRYEYSFTNKMNDYTKFGVWPDGYYMTINQFTNATQSGQWAGAGVAVLERDKMLTGQAARMVYFDLYSVNPSFGGMLPSDLDGVTPPPAGAPNYLAEVDDSTWIAPTDALRLWNFHVDWTNTANSTFGVNGLPNSILTVTNFAPLCLGIQNCIPQPGTSQRLDAIADRLMHRLAYRNFGDHAALVLNHTVDAGSGRAGIRWYEVRDPGGSPTLYQQGTYAPAGTEHRWMGSLAMDHTGDMALGYSVSSSNVYPSIRYTGRLAGDPLGQMAQGEATLIAGAGSQTSPYARWGDYSMMSVDPLDDCTFWYTQEYYQTTSSSGWQTRMGSFKFPSCSAGPQGMLTGIVSDALTTAPIVGAMMQALSSPTQTFSTTSGVSGVYSLSLPIGVYTVTASAHGYQSATISDVWVLSNTTTTQNVSLVPPPYGVVLDPLADTRSGAPGATVTFTLRVTNTGSLSDTINFTYADYTWLVTLLSGSGSLLLPPSVTLTEGTGVDVMVHVTIPITATGGMSDTVTITATSQGDASKSARSTLMTTANTLRGVVLTPPTAARSGNPGATVTYTLRLTNTGNAPDTFTMMVSGNSWTMSAPTTVGPLASGTGANAVVSVTIASNVPGGATDTALVTAISQGDASKSASSTLTTTANTLRGVTLMPSTAGQSGNPGTTVMYTLRLTNTGNAPDTFTMMISGNGWATFAPTTVGPLASGTGANVVVSVTIASNAAGGMSDTVTIIATSQGDPTLSAASALTTAAMYQFYLPIVFRN
jgi:uncharacterized membrane protein